MNQRTCPQAASGCDYPASECIGRCSFAHPSPGGWPFPTYRPEPYRPEPQPKPEFPEALL